MKIQNCFSAVPIFCICSTLLGQGIEEETLIKKRTEAYAEAYNRHDPKAIASFWAEDGEITNPESGDLIQGRAAIEKSFEKFFKDGGETKLEIKPGSITFPSKDLAIESGLFTIKRAGEAPQESAFRAYFEKKNNDWEIGEIRNVDIAAVPDNYQYLKQLEWLIGDWVDKDKDVEIESSHKWDDSKNFITGKFSVTTEGHLELKGTTIIGWDPIKKTIRSWIFDSDGGFGEAHWGRKGNSWISETAQTLADGNLASAINIYTPVDANRYTWESTGREVGGMILPNIEPITINRKKVGTLLSIANLDARDDGGEGSMGLNPGRSIQRSPSMSRATRPASISRPQLTLPTRPASAPTYASSQARRATTTIPKLGGQTATKEHVQNFIKTNPTNSSTMINPKQQVAGPDKFQNAGNTVRNNISSRYPNRNTWFNRNFWNQHHYRPSYYSYPGHWWTAATAAGIGSWLGWNSQPYYYGDYADYGATSSYWGNHNPSSDSTVSYVETLYAPSQLSELATTEELVSSEAWLSLGVFAVAKDSQSIASPNMFMQLALGKTGIIAGTFYNATTNQAYELEGIVDHAFQRAAWKIADNDASPMIETGIYNLTQDQSPIRIYFPNGIKQDMLLVRTQEF